MTDPVSPELKEENMTSVAGSADSRCSATETDTQHSAGKPDPNPEWEAKADAAHEAIRAEVGECNPFDTLTMLETWKAHAEPADCDGRITFSRAMLDSAQDALRVALEMARTEHLQAKRNFVAGAQECREMLARFVEQGDGPIRGGVHVLIAQSIRANWNPSWGDDPGPPRNMRDHGWLGPDLHDKAEAITALNRRADTASGGRGEGASCTDSGSTASPKSDGLCKSEGRDLWLVMARTGGDYESTDWPIEWRWLEADADARVLELQAATEALVAEVPECPMTSDDEALWDEYLAKEKIAREAAEALGGGLDAVFFTMRLPADRGPDDRIAPSSEAPTPQSEAKPSAGKGGDNASDV